MESKFTDTSLNNTGFAVDVPINNPPEGTGAVERNGRKIRSYAYEYKVRQSGTSAAAYCRVILYVPKQANQTLSFTTIDDAVPNDKFWVLHDKLYSAGTISAAGYPQIFGQARVRQPLTAEFDDAGNQVRGQVRMFVCSDLAGGFISRGTVKCWYKDI